ncbi:MAG: AMIN domain-containing protein [candidate division Zixibacteria bacterium]|nr:AMIN domain-containing protein [candidate division Zixibacteria bacterium]
MKKMIYILIFVLLGISQVFAARVTNVELSYLENNTVAKIYVDGKIRFVHQTEDAKDGKPFRVIVDVLAATHNLGQQNFTDLPDCLVQSVRSSQYSVKPEQIVRVVFDLEEAVVYRVDADNSVITVYFQDNQTKSFAPWSTVKYLSDLEKKQEKKADQIPVPAVAKAEPPADKPAVREPVVKTTTPTSALAQKIEKKEPAQPVLAQKTEKEVSSKPAATEVEKPLPVEKQKSEARPTVVVKEQIPPPKKESKPADEKETPQYTTVEKTRKTNQNNSSAPLGSVKKESKSQPSQSESSPVKPAPVKQVKEAADRDESKPAAAPKVEEKETKSKSTSRFRRSPTGPTKIKGTLVAEFPKRLVVKYKARSYRDPFETLINESRTYDSPIEQRLPNVEGLKLVGIIESGSGNRALFEDNEGYSYILKSGDKVKKGYVLRVENDRVYFQIFEYGWSRTVALKIEEY